MTDTGAALPTARGCAASFYGPTGGHQLFPLQKVPVPAARGTGRCRRVARRRAAQAREVNEAIYGLNFLCRLWAGQLDRAAWGGPAC